LCQIILKFENKRINIYKMNIRLLISLIYNLIFFIIIYFIFFPNLITNMSSKICQKKKSKKQLYADITIYIFFYLSLIRILFFVLIIHILYFCLLFILMCYLFIKFNFSFLVSSCLAYAFPLLSGNIIFLSKLKYICFF